MVYSKFLKHSSCLVCRSLKTIKFSQTNGKSFNLCKANSLSSWGSNIYLNNSQYSTIFSSKFSDHTKSTLKCASPLKFTAFMSTDGSSEKYQVVITDPTEGTSTTLNSSLSSASEIKHIEEIPTAPDLTDVATTISEELTSVADVIEPSLESLGLAHWTPVGLVQMFFEHMHIAMHWPWWLTIVTTTVIARILFFPILVKTQKNAINMSNYMPQLQFLQMKFGEARRSGNSMEAAKYSNEMFLLMKEGNINPIKTALFPLIQAPVFLSFFLALRGMAKAPVETMKDGGILWATDLTIPDPYYILPLIACSTLYVVIKIGAESGLRMENMKMAKYFLQAVPVIALPFCINFPSAVLYYWCTNNFCTLAITSILKIQPVREYFKMPIQQPLNPKFILPKKGFVRSVREAYEDQKVLGAVEDRRRVDNVRFQKAGTGPIPRTYSYDPTKPRPSNVASTASKSIAAKGRNV